MFGNIKPLRAEMKICDYTNYRAYYCSLCKSMGAEYAGLCNFGLSYEAVFIAVLLSALGDEKVMLKNRRCFMHPLVKRPMVTGSRSVDKAALVNVLLMYNSLKDNINDENDFKSRLACAWFKRPYKKAAKKNPTVNSIIEKKLDELSLYEEGLCDVIDRAAQPFSEMMGEIAAELVEVPNDDVYWFGFFLGKWIYVLDAYDDIIKDAEKNAYNPFISAYKNNESNEVKRVARDDAEFVLSGALRELGLIYERLDIKRNKEIIENILFEGMPKRTEDVLQGKPKKNTKIKGEYEML